MLGFIFPGQCCLCCSGRRREPLRRCWQNGNKKIWRAAGGSEHFPEAICMTEWGISRNQFQGCHLNSQSLPYLLYRETSCLGFFFFNKWKYSVNCKNWSPPGGWKMTLSIFRRCRFRICCLCSQEKMVMESLAEIQRFLGCLSQPITLAYITWQSASFCCIETTWNPICILYEQPSENGRGED